MKRHSLIIFACLMAMPCTAFAERSQSQASDVVPGVVVAHSPAKSGKLHRLGRHRAAG